MFLALLTLLQFEKLPTHFYCIGPLTQYNFDHTKQIMAHIIGQVHDGQVLLLCLPRVDTDTLISVEAQVVKKAFSLTNFRSIIFHIYCHRRSCCSGRIRTHSLKSGYEY